MDETINIFMYYYCCYCYSVVMEKDNEVKYDFLIYHEKDLKNIKDKISILNIILDIEITLLTGICFTEKLKITNAQFSGAYSKVEHLELML